MRTRDYQFGPWDLTVCPADGGRIESLRFEGRDLLTARPTDFRAPRGDFGRYETRPVFGYDDCFPTVDACPYPLGDAEIPDHGELCWLPWSVEPGADELVCRTRGGFLPVEFTRTLRFGARRLEWRFQAVNRGEKSVAFLHVMHALLPLDRVRSLRLPEYGSLWDEMNAADLGHRPPDELARELVKQGEGVARMLLLRGLAAGRAEIAFDTGLTVAVVFPHERFPTLGLWWNRAGYPAEPGCRRTECAIEPIPGTTSRLSDSHRDGVCLTLEAGQTLEWAVVWEVSRRSPGDGH